MSYAYKTPKILLGFQHSFLSQGQYSVCPKREKGSDKADERFPACFLYSGLVYTLAPRSLCEQLWISSLISPEEPMK